MRASTGDAAFDDVNYVIPTFILQQLPVGLVGLLILAILLAATDTIAGELNSLSTATVIDFYRRWVRPVAPDSHYLMVSKAATAAWGVFACVVAVWAAELGSLIEVVNRIGSFFYGSLLGVFILAIGFRARDRERRLRRPGGRDGVSGRRRRIHAGGLSLAQRHRCRGGGRRRSCRQRAATPGGRRTPSPYLPTMSWGALLFSWHTNSIRSASNALSTIRRWCTRSENGRV